MPAVGGDRGETRCQGDMEKADMVDGKTPEAMGSVISQVRGFMFSFTSLQESKRAFAGLLPPRSTPTRPASTRRCARASRTCSRYQVRPPPPSPPPPAVANASVTDVKACQFFLFCRNLKDGYFNEDAKYNLCYCESCYKLRGDEAYYKRGEPPRDYALPFGWCRFALR